MHAAGAAPVFVYRLDWDQEPTIMGSDLALMLGVTHFPLASARILYTIICNDVRKFFDCERARSSRSFEA